MPSTKVSQISFAGGEISTAMYGRSDDPKYQNGLRRCLNFITLPQGPVRNRPGFSYVNECKFSDKPTRVIPFIFNAGQTCVIELGDKYARFHSDGGTVMNGDVPYEVVTPWAADDLFDLHFAQMGDIVTVVSKKYEPYEIRRYGWTDWRVVKVTFDAALPAPTGVTAVRNTSTDNDPNKDKYTFKYCVSALNEDKSRESEPSAKVSVNANLYSTGTTVKISWNAVSGASFYRVYKNLGGLYCYIGDTEETSIIDDNIAPKADVTTKHQDKTFERAGKKPSAVGYFEQRRLFGGFAGDPQRIIMTRTGTLSDLTYSLPYKDDDRISIQLTTQEYSMVEHFVPLGNLIVLTSGAELRINPQNSDAITPTSVSAKPQGYHGASEVQPVLVNNSCVYVSSRGGHVMDVSYRYDAGGYTSDDLSIRASHFFDFKKVTSLALSKAPYQIVWAVSSDGSLLGCTYMPDQNLTAWHQHVTAGTFESVASIPDGDEDHVYVVVSRVLNGVKKKLIERMESFDFNGLENAYFVDCGGSYDGEPTTTVSIPWLNGMKVSILADGAVLPEQVVTDNRITLPVPASKVQVGLGYTSDLETLPAIMDESGYTGGSPKNVFRGTFKVYQTSGLFAGPSFDNLTEYKQRTTEQPGSAPNPVSGDIRITVPQAWSTSGSICVRQSDPLPTHILALSMAISY